MRITQREWIAAVNLSGRRLMACVVLLSSVTASILMVEGLLRIYYREEEANGNYWGKGAFIGSDATGYRHRPGFEGFVVRRKEFVTPVVIDSTGLRGPHADAQIEKPESILLLGDSFTFGVGVAEGQTFPALMRTEFNPIGVGVVNGGQSGFSAEQEKLFGLQLLSRFSPKLVIQVLFPFNDVPDDYWHSYKNVEVKFGYRLSVHRPLPYRWVDFLRAHSYFAMFLGRQLSGFTAVSNSGSSIPAAANLDASIAPTVAAVLQLRKECEAKSIIFGAVIISPKEGRSVFDNGVLAALNKDGVAVLDLGAKGLLGRQDYFRFDGHWNASGHSKAARYISPFCRSLLASWKSSLRQAVTR